MPTQHYKDSTIPNAKDLTSRIAGELLSLNEAPSNLGKRFIISYPRFY